MTDTNPQRSIGILIAASIAIIFGLLTIKSGGAVLFIDGVDRAAAGNYLPLVLWFNFVAGFFYLVAGAGLFYQKIWTAWLAFFILGTTILVFTFLGFHILNDGLYEIRTVGAMILRTIVWAAISFFAYRKFIR